VTASAGPTQRGAFQSWQAAMDRPELADDPRFADESDRIANRQVLLDIIQDWVSTFDSVEELEAAMDKGRLVLGTIRTLNEAATTEWTKARGAIVEIAEQAGTVRIPNTPWRFSGAASGPGEAIAWRGQHNAEVLSELLGMQPIEIRALEDDKVISQRPPKK
jgi:CoA:oxalate CoA-transferase